MSPGSCSGKFEWQTRLVKSPSVYPFIQEVYGVFFQKDARCHVVVIINSWVHFPKLCVLILRNKLWFELFKILDILLECMHACSVASVLFNSLWHFGLQPTRLFCPWNYPGKNTGVGCHPLLQRIFPTQGLNSGLLHWRRILYRWATREDLVLE